MGKKYKISPHEYQKILSGIELRSISLQQSKAYYNYEAKLPDSLKIDIQDSSKYKIRDENIVDIFQTYKLDARKPNSKSRYIQIEVTFVVKLYSEENFTEDFFEVYRDVSLHINTWPYLREFVNQQTARMNVPPLTLPLFKINTDDEN